MEYEVKRKGKENKMKATEKDKIVNRKVVREWKGYKLKPSRTKPAYLIKYAINAQRDKRSIIWWS